MKILDLTAGNRAIWFDKNYPSTTFVDKRESFHPTIVADSTKLPEDIGKDFDLIVFDPPHVSCGKNSNMSRVYGHHTIQQIFDLIVGAGKEAHRVSKPDALMALKWNDHDIKLSKVFRFLPNWEPLFGHITKDGPGSKTYWCMLRRKDI